MAMGENRRTPSGVSMPIAPDDDYNYRGAIVNYDVSFVFLCLPVLFSNSFHFISWLDFPLDSDTDFQGPPPLRFIYPLRHRTMEIGLFNLCNILYKQGISCIRLAADLNRGFDQMRNLGEEEEFIDI